MNEHTSTWKTLRTDKHIQEKTDYSGLVLGAVLLAVLALVFFRHFA